MPELLKNLQIDRWLGAAAAIVGIVVAVPVIWSWFGPEPLAEFVVEPPSGATYQKNGLSFVVTNQTDQPISVDEIIGCRLVELRLGPNDDLPPQPFALFQLDEGETRSVSGGDRKFAFSFELGNMLPEVQASIAGAWMTCVWTARQGESRLAHPFQLVFFPAEDIAGDVSNFVLMLPDQWGGDMTLKDFEEQLPAARQQLGLN